MAGTGSYYEHPIAFNKGFNEGIEAAMPLLKRMLPYVIYDLKKEFSDEIEKLKKPI